jgi:hypothetical protein
VTAILVRDDPTVTGRLHSIELRLRQLEQDAARAQAAKLKQQDDDRIRAQVRTELWFTAFKIVAVAQVVGTLAVLIYRSW